jgi:hypothetical protein
VRITLLNVTPSTLQDVAVPPPWTLKLMGFPDGVKVVARHAAPHAGEPISAIVVSAAATPTTDEAFRIVASENKNG